MINMLSSMAEIERLRIVSRTRDGMHQAMKQGHYVNKAPAGYRTEKSGVDKKPILVFNEDAETVRAIFKRFAEGIHSIEEVRREFMEKGFRKTKQNFIDMLANPTYTGKIRIKADPSKN